MKTKCKMFYCLFTASILIIIIIEIKQKMQNKKACTFTIAMVYKEMKQLLQMPFVIDFFIFISEH